MFIFRSLHSDCIGNNPGQHHCSANPLLCRPIHWTNLEGGTVLWQHLAVNHVLFWCELLLYVLHQLFFWITKINYEKMIESHHLYNLIGNTKAYKIYRYAWVSWMSPGKPHGRGFDPTLTCHPIPRRHRQQNLHTYTSPKSNNRIT